MSEGRVSTIDMLPNTSVCKFYKIPDSLYTMLNSSTSITSTHVLIHWDTNRSFCLGFPSLFILPMSLSLWFLSSWCLCHLWSSGFHSLIYAVVWSLSPFPPYPVNVPVLARPLCFSPCWASQHFRTARLPGGIQDLLNSGCSEYYISFPALLPFTHGADGLSGEHNPRVDLHSLWMVLSWCESVGPQVSVVGLSWNFTDDSNDGTRNHKRRPTYKIGSDRKLGERLNMLDDKLRIKNETDRLWTECNHIELNRNKYKATFLG